MLRRDFFALAGAGLLGTGFIPEAFGTSGSAGKIKWIRKPGCKLFSQAECDQKPFNRNPSSGMLDVIITFSGQEKNQPEFRLTPGKENLINSQVNASLIHRLHKTGPGQDEDLLEAILKLQNTGNTSKSIDLSFVTSTHSSEKFDDQHVYIPVSAAGLFKDTRHASIGSLNFVTDCDQLIGRSSFECNYLEPLASHPYKRKTKALILAPVVDSFYPGTGWRVALFTETDHAYEFKSEPDERNIPRWSAGKSVRMNPGEEKTFRCFLHIHQGDSYGCWTEFHKFGHADKVKVPDWLREIRVHYYDFLSSANGEKGHRGDGYESDMNYFRDYHVGLATQHGYYHAIGDFIQPGRETWQAMMSSKAGPVEMSFKKMKDRITATRNSGTHPAVYMHSLCFDDASPFFSKLKDSVMVDESGTPMKYPWSNVDTAGQNWYMSYASRDWRDFLLKQAEYIMDILNPDAIVVDETFLCLGYDEHPDRKGPLSAYSIDFMKQLRELVHSFGSDKALLSSDCSMANMIMWADGEAGDHSYTSLLGNPLYRKEPIRFEAPLCGKPWLPCSWHFIQMWEAQMDLARKSKTGVGVANGYIEFNGLKNLSPDIAVRIKKDINSLF